MKDLVMNMEDMYGHKEGVFSAARKLLNLASVDRTISTQEEMFAGTATTDSVFKEDLVCVHVSFQTYLQSERIKKRQKTVRY
jgi:hypothetical protein